MKDGSTTQTRPHPTGLPLTFTLGALHCTVRAWLVNQPLIHFFGLGLTFLLVIPVDIDMPRGDTDPVLNAVACYPPACRAALAQLGPHAMPGIAVMCSSSSRFLGTVRSPLESGLGSAAQNLQITRLSPLRTCHRRAWHRLCKLAWYHKAEFTGYRRLACWPGIYSLWGSFCLSP